MSDPAVQHEYNTTHAAMSDLYARLQQAETRWRTENTAHQANIGRVLAELEPKLAALAVSRARWQAEAEVLEASFKQLAELGNKYGLKLPVSPKLRLPGD